MDSLKTDNGSILDHSPRTSEKMHPEELAGIDSALLYKQLVQGVADHAIFLLDPQGVVSSWNTGAQRAKGYTTEEILGLHFSVFYTPTDRANGVPQQLLATALTRGRAETTGWRLRKDGSQFWANVVLQPIYRNNGSLLGFAKITRDCTEQLRQEEAKFEIENRFRMLVEAISDYAIYMLDVDGAIINWNSGAERIKGYRAEEILGRNFSSFYLEQEKRVGLPRINLETALAAGRFEGEGWRRRKDGSIFWANVVISPIFKEDGEVLGFAKITRDCTEQRKSADHITYLARHDSLTDLPNRSYFLEQLDAVIARRSPRKQLALVSIDLNNFKEINDTYGHTTGDNVLAELAARMRAMSNTHTCFARMGGDEFVAFTLFEQEEELQTFVRTLLRQLSNVIDLGETTLIPGASIGVAQLGIDADGRAQLLNNADLAMYHAKKSSTDKICFYQQGMDESERRRRQLARDLRSALQQNQFFLTYQVQRSVDGERVQGFEALIRWRHPEHGLIPPDIFIPLAEECGAIGELGEWVLRTACRQALEWNLGPKIAVNLSALQLNDPALGESVAGILHATGYPAQRLELEVTETAIMSNRDLALGILKQIKALGVTIAIDDFGTGYSSFETLRAFPFDKIKMDKSFLRGNQDEQRTSAFIRAVVALGVTLDMAVIAEGVETEQQLAMLRHAGCQQIQGYLFGRPSTPEQLAELKLAHLGSAT